MKAFTIMNHS